MERYFKKASPVKVQPVEDCMDIEVKLKQVLKRVFKHDTFREGQLQVCLEAVKQRDVFVCIPTGSGKSLLYQLPAVYSKKVTIVISPLLALAADQYKKMASLHIPILQYNSSIPIKKRQELLAKLCDGSLLTKIIFTTPESLVSEPFQIALDKLHNKKRLERLVVDEAHCISEYGHDFRPKFLSLSTWKENFPDLPITALTATATSTAQRDILTVLKLSNPYIYKVSVNRDNLFYDIKYRKSVTEGLTDLVSLIDSFRQHPQPLWQPPAPKRAVPIENEPKLQESKENIRATPKKDYSHIPKIFTETGIIYCRTIQDCEDIAAHLKSKGYFAKTYHAKLGAKKRLSVQSKWMQNKTRIVVATISFGMGIDKPDVRFVVHWSIPKSIEAYAQESGRAGRDGKSSYCRLYYCHDDRDAIVYCIKIGAAAGGLNVMDPNGISMSSPAPMSLSKIAMLEKRLEQSLLNVKEVCEYATSLICRKKFICQYFGELGFDPKISCMSHCDYCKDPTQTRTTLKTYLNSFRKGYREDPSSTTNPSDLKTQPDGIQPHFGSASELYTFCQSSGSVEDLSRLERGEPQEDSSAKKIRMEKQFVASLLATPKMNPVMSSAASLIRPFSKYSPIPLPDGTSFTSYVTETTRENAIQLLHTLFAENLNIFLKTLSENLAQGINDVIVEFTDTKILDMIKHFEFRDMFLKKAATTNYHNHLVSSRKRIVNETKALQLTRLVGERYFDYLRDLSALLSTKDSQLADALLTSLKTLDP